MTPRRRRWRPDCSTIVLALAVTAAGAVVVLHELVVWLAAHPAAVAAVIGAVVLAVPAGRRIVLGDGDTAPTSAFEDLSSTEFEEAVAALCRRDGCQDVQVVGGSGDLGADVLATLPDGRRMVVQCKRYAPGRRVGSPEVQRVGGTYAIVHRAEVALVVTTAGFTEAAEEYAARAGIRLVDGEALDTWRTRGRAPWQQ